MKKTQSKYHIATIIALAALVLYLSSLKHQFIVWDDDLYVYENLHIRSLDRAFFRWAFFDFHAGNWHPLTWISHALDYAIWGLNPLGHHLTNIILHSLNTFMVVLLVVMLLEAGNVPGPINARYAPPLNIRGGRGSYDPIGDGGGFPDRSVLVAASTTGLLFGIHPLHVESVAWVSERKDLLCALFFVLSIMAYLRYAGNAFLSFLLVRAQTDSPGRTGNPSEMALNTGKGPGQTGTRGPGPQFFDRYYFLSLFFFSLALLSKPMAVTLPVVLLILDWYPLGRSQPFKTTRTAIVEKLPFIVLSLGSSVLTVLAQKAGDAVTSIEVISLSTRIPVAAKALVGYLGKIILPLNLSPFYPYPKEASLLSIEYLSAIVLVLGITTACAVMAKRQKFWLSAWGYYVIMLIPVLGIVQVGLQSMADRYTYLPSLGPFLVMGIMASWVWARAESSGKQSRIAKVLAVAATVLVIVSLSYATLKQTGIWRDSIVFWSYVIEKEPERVPVAYYNRGIAFFKMGMPEKAIADYDQAIALKPSYYDAYNNRGLALEKIGLLERAVKDLEVAMAMKPSSPEAHDNLGKIYRKTGHFDAAVRNYDRAIELKPSYYEAYYDRAIAYEKMGQRDRAIEDYDRAIALNPSYYEAYNNLGVLYGNAGLYDKAIENLTKAVLVNPGHGGAYGNRGALHARTGKKELAASDFQKACELGDRAGCRALDAINRKVQSP